MRLVPSHDLTVSACVAIIKKASRDVRAGDTAGKELRDILEAYGFILATRALEYTRYARRRTISKEDIKLAVKPARSQLFEDLGADVVCSECGKPGTGPHVKTVMGRSYLYVRHAKGSDRWCMVGKPTVQDSLLESGGEANGH